jgi:hypothetical protein
MGHAAFRAQVGCALHESTLERVLQAHSRIAPFCGTNSNSQDSNNPLKLHAERTLNTGKF